MSRGGVDLRLSFGADDPAAGSTNMAGTYSAITACQIASHEIDMIGSLSAAAAVSVASELPLPPRFVRLPSGILTFKIGQRIIKRSPTPRLAKWSPIQIQNPGRMLHRKRPF